MQDITVHWLIGVAFSVWGLTHVVYFLRAWTIPEWRRALADRAGARRRSAQTR